MQMPNWAFTEFTFTREITTRFQIGKASGNLAVLPKSRSWKLVFAAVNPTGVVVTADQAPLQAKVSYDRATSRLTVELPETAIEKEISVLFPEGLTLAENNLTERCYELLEPAQIGYDLKSRIYGLVQEQGRNAIASLAALSLNEALFGALCEILNCLKKKILLYVYKRECHSGKVPK